MTPSPRCQPVPLGPSTSSNGPARPTGLHAALAFLCLLAGYAAFTLSSGAGSPAADSLSERVANGYGELPLRFEANRGQTDRPVQFVSRGPGYGLFLTPREAVLSLTGGEASGARDVVRMRLAGANANPPVEGIDRLPGKSTYLEGERGARSHTVPSFGQVKYQAVYPGIDLVYHGKQRSLEYDFRVAPGADPKAIALDFRGVRRLTINGRGDLLADAGHGALRQKRPVLFQRIDGVKRPVEGRYVLHGKRRVGFRVGTYDRSKPLVIDPVLSYATYLGGTGGDTPNGIGADSAGNAYVTGSTASLDFPTAGPVQGANGGSTTTPTNDAFVTKLNPTGSELVYSTYLGGSGADVGRGIAVDATGAYVTGETASTNFPTDNPIQGATGGGTDAFVAKLNPAGSELVYSTYLGGSGTDVGRGIALEGGRAHVTGSTASANFPAVNPVQATSGGGTDAFLTRLNAAGSAREYSTFIGGSGADNGRGVAADATGTYVAGDTTSTNLPTANPLQAASGGGTDAFVTKVNAAGSARDYSTYLGGSAADNADGIAVRDGNAYLTGDTDSTNFPTAGGPPQGASAGGGDAFVTKLGTAGSSLAYSTYLGGSGSDGGNGIAVDSSGRASIVGSTSSGDFPLQSPLAIKQGNADMLTAQLNAAGSGLVYSSPLGGSASESGTAIAVDPSDGVYLTGSSLRFSDDDVPTTSPFQPNNRGGTDSLVAKILPDNPAAPLITGLATRSGPPSGGTTVEITGRGFTGATAVTFGGTRSPSVTVNSPTKITARSPARAEGNVFIRVTNAAGTSPANPVARFMYAEGSWSRTGPLVAPRQTHTTTLLANGKVLAAGGRVTGTFASLSSSELYDPKTGTWSATAGSMSDPRFGHSATLLNGPECHGGSRPAHCGKVLVAAGFTGASSANAQAVLASAELYDPGTGTWSPAGALNTRRSLHAATLLKDGRVLVAGGRSCNAPPPTACNSTFTTNSAEVYDPATNTWTTTSPMLTARHTNAAALLPDGKVLVPGGFGGDVPAPAESTAELYTPAPNPANSGWSTCPTPPGSPNCPGPLTQQHARGGATLLPNGKVIVTAGFPNNDVGELWDPATGEWTRTESLKSFGRFNFYYALLPNGKFLLAGGGNGGTTSEIYNPADGKWNWAGLMSTAHGSSSSNANSQQAVVLSSDPSKFEADSSVCGSNCGKVLVAGNSEDRTSDLYTPERAVGPPPPLTPRYPLYPKPPNNCPTGTSAGVTCQTLPGGGRRITGTAGNDRIVGTAGNDVINCGPGNDVVSGGAGNDTINCGAGNDRVNGNAGNDRLFGDSGNDRLSGDSGNDSVSGGTGNDRASGAGGRDRINGNSGNDVLSGNSGNDSISGSSGRDRISGGSGSDRASGNSGTDRVSGDSGRDRVNGGSGRDRLSAGSGNDSISARDRTRDTVNCGRGRDRVTADRRRGRDRVSRNCERVRRR